MLNELIGAVVQVLFFSLLPLAVWLDARHCKFCYGCGFTFLTLVQKQLHHVASQKRKQKGGILPWITEDSEILL